jgi:hypothetical protein
MTITFNVILVILLLLIYRRTGKIMSTEADLQTSLDAIKAGVANVVAKLTTQAQTIADLQAQIAAGTPVSQEQLDALAAEANDIAASLSAVTA